MDIEYLKARLTEISNEHLRRFQQMIDEKIVKRLDAMIEYGRELEEQAKIDLLGRY